MTKWIVVTDAARARFFSADAPKADLLEMEDRVHVQSRFHGRDLETDAAPRTFDSAGTGRHAIEPSTSIREQEVDKFARELADYLVDAYTAGSFHQLYLTAPPHFLGLLRKHMGDTHRTAVTWELDKDLTRHSVAEIRAHLPEFL